MPPTPFSQRMLVTGLALLALLGNGLSARESEDPARPAESEAAPAASEPAAPEPAGAAEPAGSTAEVEPATGPKYVRDDGEPWSVYVVPIQDMITRAQLFILRRAIKDALTEEVDAVILDMDTPGGDLFTTLEMMKALDQFDGQTAVFVNEDAISAGAYISVATEDIYFSPRGKIGAAAVISGTGEEVPETAKMKIDSYTMANVRIVAKDKRYREQVMRAMMDEDYVLEIEGEVLKPEGELLTLTADQSMEAYGDPPVPLLGSGVHDSIDDLLDARYGAGNYTVRDFDITWSEELAKYLQSIAPLMLGIGMLLIFIEFKTPGFGVFGIGGIVLLLVFFASNYVAGLAGYEEVILFLFGVLLVVVELFVLPGLFIFGALGVTLMLGALVWAMADIWPEGAEEFELSGTVFMEPMLNLTVGLAIGFVGIFLVARFLPHNWVWGKLVLASADGKPSVVTASAGSATPVDRLPEAGTRATVLTRMVPSGEVQIDGKRFAAQARHGSLEARESVVVVGRSGYNLIVDRADNS